ncbi:MAG: hypothetical protein JXR41_09810 [Bacteroidales bacterium]|nr:hypothetical protein [Bacteroidales bacterium]MBN2763375.1 hypothetical protein [Bacteroidales bacterium]
MKNFIYCILVLMWFSCAKSFGQSFESSRFNNSVYLQFNHHLEKRGSESYYTGNPDFAVSYERRIVHFGRNNILVGIRSGVYREYVLTGPGWSHPTKTRFFIGPTPSYRIDVSRRIKFQFNILWDVLLPDDYDEIWSYFAIEPSFNFYFNDHFYAAVSAAMGTYYFFDPRAYMDKAGIKVGYAFGR